MSNPTPNEVRMGSSDHLETLFTNQTPTSFGFRTQAEDDFSYINSHADGPVIAVRSLLEDWFQHYPLNGRVDIARRFRSSRFSQHQGAFWELYLHELFRRMGFTIRTHPDLSGTVTRPDLLLIRDDVPYAVVEARLAGLPSGATTSANRLKAELRDSLNRIHSPNFFLMIEELSSGPRLPSFKPLMQNLERWLSSLDPDEPNHTLDGNGARFEWSEDGWLLRVNVIPKSAQTRGKPGIRSLGSTGFEIGWLDTVGELRSALRDKAGKYGDLRLPYIIAVNYMGMHCDHSDWCDTLYGSQAVHIYFDDRGRSFQHPFRKNDGFWIRNGNAQKEQVSAVLGGWHISPWTIGVHPVEIYDHFSPSLALGSEVHLPRWFIPVGKDELKMRHGSSAAQILDIPKGWPGDWQLA